MSDLIIQRQQHKQNQTQLPQCNHRKLNSYYMPTNQNINARITRNRRVKSHSNKLQISLAFVDVSCKPKFTEMLKSYWETPICSTEKKNPHTETSKSWFTLFFCFIGAVSGDCAGGEEIIEDLSRWKSSWGFASPIPLDFQNPYNWGFMQWLQFFFLIDTLWNHCEIAIHTNR